MPVTLVLGGVRSGKSAHAESLLADAVAAGRARYLATASAPTTDGEFAERIAAHRERRPAGWTTVETSDVAAALGGANGDPWPTLIDDLGGWLTARLDAADAWDRPEAIGMELNALVATVTGYPERVVLVSPEVGLSLVPTTHAGRVFQDLMGRLNAALAAAADTVVLLVAGLPTVLKGDGAAAPALAGAPATAVRPAPVTAAATPAPAAAAGDDPLRFPTVSAPDAAIAHEARSRQRELTKPAGSLGRIEELGVWAAACQGACPPRPFERPRIVVFAGDHGVAESGVSAYPAEVTAQMVANFAAGGAAINVLGRQAGAGVRIEDIAVRADTEPALSRYNVRRSCGDIAFGDALTDDETIAALAAGRAIADDEVDSGADLLILGDMGIGNTTPAAVLIGALTGTEPVLVVGRGTGIDDAGWMRKTAAVRDAMYRARPHTANPKALLRTVAGADLTAMAGFLAQAAVRRTPVLLDGMVVTAAALVAADLAPGAQAWWTAGHRSTEPAHALALDRLGLLPMLDLGLRLGEGSGAALALPLVQAAVAVLAEMATFGEAGVSRD